MYYFIEHRFEPVSFAKNSFPYKIFFCDTLVTNSEFP